MDPSRVQIMFNPGVPVNKYLYKLADTINIFEDTCAKLSLAKLNAIDWHGSRDPIQILTNSNVGGFLFTTDKGYWNLSTLWPQLCADLAVIPGQMMMIPVDREVVSMETWPSLIMRIKGSRVARNTAAVLHV
ncbi:hypothetical protein BJ878DRAFT_493135 [Calycina marina]|uniref:Uncharacterized protein n=1 Tax=Calycina marina TaxID=1763456 RepID=A0A9P7Z8J3_9HELO|nr:hypothetical protein BJ878DRAFT_493135 [Calycina marina]